MINKNYLSSSEIYRFEERFNAHARPSNPGIEILMSERSFGDLLEVTYFLESEEYRHFQYMNGRMGSTWLNQVLKQQDREEREQHLRTKFPALQEAWEQYQIVLKLVG